MSRIELLRARLRDRPVLWRLMQLYLYEFSQIDGRSVNERGEFEYTWFDHYWREPERVPLLVWVDGEWAGFALVRLGRPNQIAEFFVLRKHRRSGVGRTVAAECFARWPGPWMIHEVLGNDQARAFWRAAIPVPFKETSNKKGTTQRFRIPPVRGRATAPRSTRARPPNS